MSDEFEWHTNALKGTRGPIHDGDPQSGYYRQKRKDGTYEPVAYWKDSNTGEQRCHVNGKSPQDPLRMMEIWPYAARYPISAEAYWHRMDTGQWLDNDAGAAEAAKGPDIDPATDPVGSMKAEIDKARAGLPAYKAIESDEQAAKAQTLRSALTGLSGKADKKRKEIKEPHLAASRAVDAEWMPLVTEAAAGANEIRKALEGWEDVKRDAARKAQAEADRIAREHAEAARKAEEANQPPPPPPPAAPVPNAPAPSTQIKGASGRAASVGVKNVVTAIDVDKAFKQFREKPELYAFLLDLSQKALNAGIPPDGATIEEKSNIR